MKFAKISLLVFLLVVSVFSGSDVLIASDFEYMGPSHNYRYSYSYINNEYTFDVIGNFFSDCYVNKKIIDNNGLVYSLYMKNNSVMINGDFEETW